jgi:hypothetical protein
MFHEKKAALCFDADPDPDPTVHFDADADPGSGTYPKFTHFGKSELFKTLIHTAVPVYFFIFFVSVIRVIIFNSLENKQSFFAPL